jgi:hypothetical protein
VIGVSAGGPRHGYPLLRGRNEIAAGGAIAEIGNTAIAVFSEGIEDDVSGVVEILKSCAV